MFFFAFKIKIINSVQSRNKQKQLLMLQDREKRKQEKFDSEREM
jgi:hypothetical protein